MIHEWSEKKFFVLFPSQVPSEWLKKFFVGDPSSISHHGEKANGILFRSMVMVSNRATMERYKGERLVALSPHSAMLNIIPLPFESSLSVSYADASELAQAMQHLERHLAHVINIRVTSKFCCSLLAPSSDHCFLQVCWRRGLRLWGWNSFKWGSWWIAWHWRTRWLKGWWASCALCTTITICWSSGGIPGM